MPIKVLVRAIRKAQEDGHRSDKVIGEKQETAYRRDEVRFPELSLR